MSVFALPHALSFLLSLSLSLSLCLYFPLFLFHSLSPVSTVSSFYNSYSLYRTLLEYLYPLLPRLLSVSVLLFPFGVFYTMKFTPCNVSVYYQVLQVAYMLYTLNSF
jgi:hypothetical protein